MPPRLNKRQQRELEELEALSGSPGGAPQPNAGEEKDVAEIEPVSTSKSKSQAAGFAALLQTDVIASEPEDEEDDNAPVASSKSSKNKKKKKKKPSAVAAPTSTVDVTGPSSDPPTSTPAPSNTIVPVTLDPVQISQQKKDKKARQKAKKAADGDDGQDEVDRAIAELSLKYPDLKPPSGPTAAHSTALTPASKSLAALLATQSQHLDPAAELRKFFGAKVVNSASSSSAGGAASGRGGGAGRRKGGQGAADTTLGLRSQIVKPKAEWWPAKARDGLGLRALSDDEVKALKVRRGWVKGASEGSDGVQDGNVNEDGGERWWTVEYSRKYMSVTKAFMQTVLSGDPEGFWRLLQTLVYHADTLLQLSEGYRYREEHSTATDFVERALYAYERAFVGAFNFTAGINRLDFDRAENRPFFLALHRVIIDLQRRGCFRTAFEYARMLLALNPWSDPHGALLHLDFLAPKTGLGSWMLELWDLHAARAPTSASSSSSGTAKKSNGNSRINVTALPGWAYARALALRAKEDGEKDKEHKASTEALREAIITFPSIVPLLADKAEITLPDGSRAHTAFRIQTDASSFSNDAECVLHLLSHLYAQRSSQLWKSPTLGNWFSSVVSAALPSLPSSSTTKSTAFATLFNSPSLCYSIYRHASLQDPAYRPLLSFIPRAAAASTTFAGDPLPPLSALSSYSDPAFFASAPDINALAPRLSRRQEQRALEQLVPDPNARAELQALYNANPAVARRFPGGVVQFVQMAAQMDEGGLDDLMIEIAQAGDDEGLGEGEGQGQMPGGVAMWDVDFGAAAPQGPEGANDEESDDEEGQDGDDDDEEGVPAMPVRMLRNVLNRFWGGPVPRVGDEDAESDEDPDEDGGQDAPGPAQPRNGA